MAPLRARLVASWLIAGAAIVGGCSPEARRARDGGPGADPGNKRLVERPYVDPKAADSTLLPGRAPAPVERLEAGTMYPPPSPTEAPATSAPSKDEQRTFEQR